MDTKAVVIIKKGNWKFRLMSNARVESCNEAKRLPWGDRTPQQIGLVDDHFAILEECLNTLTFGISDPDEGIPAPNSLEHAMGPQVAETVKPQV